MNAMFSPSLMCMDLLNIKEQAEILNERCSMYHLDIMDGHFVKNITLSPSFVAAFSKIATQPIDSHLMVTSPDDYIEELAKAGTTYISPHAETINSDAFRIIKKIKDNGCKAGIVLNPATPIDYIRHYIHLLDKITIMSVDPGFAGQPFIREMLDKISEARDIKNQRNLDFIIEVDGSCNKRTFRELYKAGTEMFVVGSSGLFDLDEDLSKAWDMMIENFKEETKM